MLEIRNLHVAIEEKEILKGIDLCIKKGEIHAIMGPNGSGKSTLAKVLAGHPSYEVLEGEILFQGQNIVELDPEERAASGLFMSFQYPLEIPGVSNREFLKAALRAHRKGRNLQELSEEDFSALLSEKMKSMEIRSEFKERNLNEGFSGGEKKRNEILQLSLFDPLFAVLDETDSGLDIDAIRIVAKGVTAWMSDQKACLLITHYQRLLEYIKPQYIHVCIDGKIVSSGGAELALELEEKGYDWLMRAI